MMAGAVKKAEAQFILHGSYAAAHGGLGYVTFFGCFGEIEVLCYTAEVLKAVDIHKNDLQFLNIMKKSMVNINGF